MKKIFVILLLLIAPLYSQNYFSDKTFHFGLKLGANFAHIVGTENSEGRFTEAHSKFGPAIGVIFDKKIGRLTSLQGEIIYNDVGSKWQQPWYGIGWSGDYAIYKLKYITIPIYVKISNELGGFLDNFDLIIGASYSYNISAKQEILIEADGYSPDYGPENIKDDINRHETGLLFGIKIPYNKKRRKIYINVQFYWALTHLYKSDAVTYPDGVQDLDKLKSRNLSVSLEYFFK